MLMTVFKVLYVVIAILMIAFILLQRGAGAQQGGGFGSGASATVFGASGSANFLSKSTKWLAAFFFGLSIAMAAMISGNYRRDTAVDVGVMGAVSAETPAVAPVAESETPASGNDASAPAAATTPATETPAAAGDASAPSAEAPAVEAPAAVEAVPPAAESETPATAAPVADKQEQKSDN